MATTSSVVKLAFCERGMSDREWKTSDQPKKQAKGNRRERIQSARQTERRLTTNKEVRQEADAKRAMHVGTL
jgi:hypothetical protein